MLLDHTVRYEDLLSDTVGELERILEFFGFEDIDKKILEETVAFGKFENMRKMEEENFFNHKGLRVRNEKDIGNYETYKTRSGVAGNFRQYLDKV